MLLCYPIACKRNGGYIDLYYQEGGTLGVYGIELSRVKSQNHIESEISVRPNSESESGSHMGFSEFATQLPTKVIGVYPEGVTLGEYGEDFSNSGCVLKYLFS